MKHKGKYVFIGESVWKIVHFQRKCIENTFS